MTAEQIVAHCHNTPFRPFTMFLADGRSVSVAGADCVTFDDDPRIVFVYVGDADAGETIDLGLVVSLRRPEAPTDDHTVASAER